jgi:hypothetical protein
MNYDITVIQATRFRHMNIARIQHDLLRLQHVLTCPGGGTEENFARLSSLLHEHGKVQPLLSILHSFLLDANQLTSFIATAIRDLDFIHQSTFKISHNPRYMENLLSLYPEIRWDKATAPHRLALIRGTEDKPKDIVSFTRATLPRSWCWSKAERELRPASYKLDLQGVPGLGPRQLSLTVTILTGTIISLASSALILVPIIIMSFQTERTKSLVTVAVAVTLFGSCLAVVVRTKSSDTFLATATYAAVLVVFVGASGSGHR